MDTPDWFRRTEGGYVLDAAGGRVCRIDIAYVIDLYIIEPGPGFQVRFEQPFSIDGALVAPGSAETLAPLASLFGAEVDHIVARDNGELVMTFRDGRILMSSPHDSYEAWQVSGEFGFQIVAMPAGQLAVWGPRQWTWSGPNSPIAPYIALMEAFLSGSITASAFQMDYLRTFKEDSTHWGADVFSVLDVLFGDADSYVSDPDARATMRARPGYQNFYLDERQLAESASRALAQLLALRRLETEKG